MLLKRISLVMPGLALAVVIMAMPTAAIEVQVTHLNLAPCDRLVVPPLVDELGIGFPPDELISAEHFPTTLIACPSNNTALPNFVVEMQNRTRRTFPEVWYVADPETTLTNFDGTVNDEPAFRIDSRISDPNGGNLPLIFESINPNDVFQPNEIWQFVIDGYRNANGLPPSALASPGLVGILSGGDQMSSGSIIAVPEPGSWAMLMLGAVWIITSVRRRM